MTPDEIEKAAIEAAAKKMFPGNYEEEYGRPAWEAWPNVYEEYKLVAAHVIRAYEREMWRSAKSIPKDGSKHLLSDGVDVWIGSERDSNKSHMGMPVDGHELHSGPKGWQQRATHFRPLPKPEGV